MGWFLAFGDLDLSEAQLYKNKQSWEHQAEKTSDQTIIFYLRFPLHNQG